MEYFCVENMKNKTAIFSFLQISVRMSGDKKDF